MKRIVVQEGTKVISNYCYAGDRDISSVCAADSLTDIGVGAFKDCTGLETVILNEGLSRLRKEVFSGCDNLSQINIPGTVHSIGEWAFRGCRNLHELRIPEYLRYETLIKKEQDFVETDDLEGAMPELDILYMTRVQTNTMIE